MKLLLASSSGRKLMLFLQSNFPSARAINSRSSSCRPQESILVFKDKLQSPCRSEFDGVDAHDAVFAIKGVCTLHSSFRHSLLRHLHAHMLKTNLSSHVYVSTTLLHGYATSSLQEARMLFDEMPFRNVVTLNTMIACYSKHREVSAARSLFDGMGVRDVVTWSSLIGGYMEMGLRSHGMGLFREMMTKGQAKPDQLTLVTLLSGLAGAGSTRLLGKSIHGYSQRNCLDINMQLGTCLIDMYAKCGCMESAIRVFERMPDRNVMHWTAIICGLASHGFGADAVAFFQGMRKSGVRPNEITFTGVLNACCHAGLVEEGKKYFRSMVDEFEIEPGIHHYGCMVDLFAKAGRAEDAYGVLQDMKMEPNTVVLTSLLAACKKDNNFAVVERVLDKVLDMVSPEQDGGIYALISDLYAIQGKWNDVERLRKIMDGNNVKKNRGSSFV